MVEGKRPARRDAGQASTLMTALCMLVSKEGQRGQEKPWASTHEGMGEGRARVGRRLPGVGESGLSAKGGLLHGSRVTHGRPATTPREYLVPFLLSQHSSVIKLQGISFFNLKIAI